MGKFIPRNPSLSCFDKLLEAWRAYSTKSINLSLLSGVAVTHFKEVWRSQVLPKIKVFLWQLIGGRLGPSNGMCSMCGELEDCNHICFQLLAG
jgi:hypothetical protein